MTKIDLLYPQGKGGRWLGHLLSSLIFNKPFKEQNTHYHGSVISNSINPTHNLIFTQPLSIRFSGAYYFNMYCNYVKKTNFETAYKNNGTKTETDKHCIRIYQASYLLEFQHYPTTLSSDSIYTNTPEIFINDLYKVLDSLQITYSKNDDICISAINAFKNTIANPQLNFNKWDNIYWIYWCLGISKKEFNELPSYYEIDKLLEFLENNQNFYIDYTLERMI